MKSTLVSISLRLGTRVWVERTAYGAIAAKGDLHPDDPHICFHIGTARDCFRAISAVARASQNNRYGRIAMPKFRVS